MQQGAWVVHSGKRAHEKHVLYAVCVVFIPFGNWVQGGVLSKGIVHNLLTWSSASPTQKWNFPAAGLG